MHPYVHNLASHYGHHGVNANAVALGTVGPTGPWLEALRSDPAILEKIGSRNPRGKVGSAAEAADVMVYLVRWHKPPPTAAARLVQEPAPQLHTHYARSYRGSVSAGVGGVVADQRAGAGGGRRLDARGRDPRHRKPGQDLVRVTSCHASAAL